MGRLCLVREGCGVDLVFHTQASEVLQVATPAWLAYGCQSKIRFDRASNCVRSQTSRFDWHGMSTVSTVTVWVKCTWKPVKLSLSRHLFISTDWCRLYGHTDLCAAAAFIRLEAMRSILSSLQVPYRTVTYSLSPQQLCWQNEQPTSLNECHSIAQNAYIPSKAGFSDSKAKIHQRSFSKALHEAQKA